jgi:putative transposase
MANTYTQIHIQVVFAVKYRKAKVKPEWQEELYKYITGIIQSEGHKLLAINGTEDHIHIFFGMRPVQALSDLIMKVKSHSSKWINEKGLSETKFQWQEGFGGFSYGKSQVPGIISYIHGQEEHHRKRNFLEEYKEMLKTFEVEFDEQYIFVEPF